MPIGVFSVLQKRTAVTAGSDLRGCGISQTSNLAGISEMNFLPSKHLLRKDVWLANFVLD